MANLFLQIEPHVANYLDPRSAAEAERLFLEMGKCLVSASFQEKSMFEAIKARLEVARESAMEQVVTPLAKVEESADWVGSLDNAKVWFAGLAFMFAILVLGLFGKKFFQSGWFNRRRSYDVGEVASDDAISHITISED